MAKRWVVLLSAGVVLLAAEAGARAVEDGLPPPRVWQSIEADVKVAQMEALGHADVVFVGSSVVAGGIDPEIVGDQLGRSVYNAGLSAGFAAVTQRWTETVVLPALRPDVLVVGTISFDLYDHHSQAAFEAALVESPGGEAALGTEGPLDRLDRILGQRSALWEHRASLRRPGRVFDALTGDAEPARPEFGPVGTRGRVHYSQVGRPPGAGLGLPVATWTLDPEPRRRLRDLVRTARAAGTEVVLVVMPVSKGYVVSHPGGELDQQRYVEALADLAATEDVPLLELDTMREPERYLDQIHLDDDAADELSAALGRALEPLVGPT